MTNVENNSSHINPSFNELLTKYSNDRVKSFTKTEKIFLKDCYKINTINKSYFTRYDFPTFTPEKFRNLVSRLKFCIIRAINSRPPHFILDGLKIDNLTIEDTGLGKVKPDFENELERLSHQPPFIHDLDIQVKTLQLYEKLASNGVTPNKQNKGITIKNLPIISTKVTATAIIWSNGLLQLKLGCTYHPILYSLKGWLNVDSYCSQVMQILQGLANDVIFIPPTTDWIVTEYHFNKDGVILTNPIHHYSIARLAEHAQIYTKKLENGKTVLRYEKKETPNKTIEELINETPYDDDQYSVTFERASEIYDSKKLNPP